MIYAALKDRDPKLKLNFDFSHVDTSMLEIHLVMILVYCLENGIDYSGNAITDELREDIYLWTNWSKPAPFSEEVEEKRDELVDDGPVVDPALDRVEFSLQTLEAYLDTLKQHLPAHAQCFHELGAEAFTEFKKFLQRGDDALVRAYGPQQAA